MSNFKNDIEEVKRVLSQSIDHRNSFNSKYLTIKKEITTKIKNISYLVIKE